MNRAKLIRTALTALAFLMSGTAFAQEQRLTMPAGQMSIIDAFTAIREQADLGVVYSSELLDTSRAVAFPQTTLTVDEAMQTIAASSGIAFKYNGRMILLTKASVVAKPAALPSGEPPYTAEGYVPSNPSDFDTPLGLRPVHEKEAPVEIIIEPEPAPFRAAPVSHWRDAGEYGATEGILPLLAVKTNLLYGIGTLTPNLSLEIGLGKKTSLEMGGSYNPWNLSGSLESNKKLVHMILKPEFRYWLCERFNGHFFGVHALYARYNIGTHNVPLLFDSQYRYNGHAIGTGITYGYNLPVAKRWSVEFAIGVGAMWLKYDRFECPACNRDATPATKTYFGPTNAAISLVFLIK
jgi:hypothetical protein